MKKRAITTSSGNTKGINKGIDTHATDNAFNQYSNLKYQYQYNDIKIILRQLLNTSNVYLIDLISDSNEGYNANATQDALYEYEKVASKSNKPAIGVYNRGNLHWVAYCIIPDNKSKLVRIYYKDSLGDTLGEIKDQIGTFFESKKWKQEVQQIDKLKKEQKFGDLSCGLFAIKNAYIFANNIKIPNFNPNNLVFYNTSLSNEEYQEVILALRKEYAAIYAKGTFEDVYNSLLYQNKRIQLKEAHYHELEQIYTLINQTKVLDKYNIKATCLHASEHEPKEGKVLSIEIAFNEKLNSYEYHFRLTDELNKDVKAKQELIKAINKSLELKEDSVVQEDNVWKIKQSLVKNIKKKEAVIIKPLQQNDPSIQQEFIEALNPITDIDDDLITSVNTELARIILTSHTIKDYLKRKYPQYENNSKSETKAKPSSTTGAKSSKKNDDEHKTFESSNDGDSDSSFAEASQSSYYSDSDNADKEASDTNYVKALEQIISLCKKHEDIIKQIPELEAINLENFFEILEKVIDYRDQKENASLLHWACTYGYYELADVLITNNVKVNLLDSKYQTALHWAARAGHTNIVQLLLDRGINYLSEDTDSKDSICIAEECGFPQIAIMIKKFEEYRITTCKDNKTKIRDHNFNLVIVNNPLTFKKHGKISAIKFFNGDGKMFSEVSGKKSGHGSYKKIGEDSYPALNAMKPWQNIPDFAIITGKNGQGKTQLLSFIYDFQGAYDNERVYYLESEFNYKNTPNSDYEQQNKSISRVSRRNQTHNLKTSQIQFISKSQFEEPDNLLSYIFTKYKNDENELRQKLNTEKFDGDIDNVILKRLGKAPWDEINDIFQNNSCIKYEHHIKVHDKKDSNKYFEWNFINSKGQEVVFTSLSAGEIMILTFMVMQFISAEKNKITNEKKYTNKVNLLLLDEPDRHFDPQYTKLFFYIIRNVFLKNDIQVIMTSHRIDTISLAQEGEIFSIEKNREIAPCSRNLALLRITSSVRELTHFNAKVYTEAHRDTRFYNAIYNILLEYTRKSREVHRNLNNTKYNWQWWNDFIGNNANLWEQRVLSRRFNLDFHSTGIDEKGAGGGKYGVKESVARDMSSLMQQQIMFNSAKKLSRHKIIEPCAALSFGILDRDYVNDKEHKTLSSSLAKEQILLIERYSIENYLFDPFIICSALNMEDIDQIRDQDFKRILQDCKKALVKITPKFQTIDLKPFVEYYNKIIQVNFDYGVGIDVKKHPELKSSINEARQKKAMSLLNMYTDFIIEYVHNLLSQTVLKNIQMSHIADLTQYVYLKLYEKKGSEKKAAFEIAKGNIIKFTDTKDNLFKNFSQIGP